MASLFEKLRSAWSVFKDPNALARKYDPRFDYSVSNTATMVPGDNKNPHRSSERTFVNSLYTRIAIDCAAVDMEHVRIDEEYRYLETIKDQLNYILMVEANVDQTGREFRQELVYTLLNEGVVAVVPTLTEKTNLWEATEFPKDILAMRICKVIKWYPYKVQVRGYNDVNGRDEDFEVPKRMCWIIKNPLRHVTNDTNSSLKRLMDKLNLIDKIDAQTGSGKLDMIVQLPYSLKGESKQEWARQRKKDIEDQIYNSKLGIAYIDAAEHIQQINRPLENNLQSQIEYLTKQVYSQLGLTEEIFNGSADEAQNINYYNRTVEPILSFIANEIIRKALSLNERTRGHSIKFFRDPFKLVPVEKLADLADRMTRNEIMSSNEFRAILGYKPSSDPGADQLINKNINHPEDPNMQQPDQNQQMPPEDPNQPPPYQDQQMQQAGTSTRYLMQFEPNEKGYFE